jgi:hypothetical protein
MKMVSYQQKSIKYHWHIDTGNGISLCQTVGIGDVVQADIENPMSVRICMKCWKKHNKTKSKPNPFFASLHA